MKIILIFLSMLLIGCIAGGGGGSFHFPPVNLDPKINNEFEIELILAGDGVRNIPIRYSNVTFFYRVNAGKEISYRMNYIGIRDNKGVWSVVIPPFSAKGGDTLFYRFEFLLDDNKNVRNESAFIK